MIKILHHPHRLYLFNRHLHHGLTGCIFIGIGIALVATDWRDFPWRFIEDFEKYLIP